LLIWDEKKIANFTRKKKKTDEARTLQVKNLKQVKHLYVDSKQCRLTNFAEFFDGKDNVTCNSIECVESCDNCCIGGEKHWKDEADNEEWKQKLSFAIGEDEDSASSNSSVSNVQQAIIDCGWSEQQLATAIYLDEEERIQVETQPLYIPQSNLSQPQSNLSQKIEEWIEWKALNRSKPQQQKRVRDACMLCGETHLISACPKLERQCSNCGLVGHGWKNCQQVSKVDNFYVKEGCVKCFLCHEPSGGKRLECCNVFKRIILHGFWKTDCLDQVLNVDRYSTTREQFQSGIVKGLGQKSFKERLEIFLKLVEDLQSNKRQKENDK
jgi:hypothetical protein